MRNLFLITALFAVTSTAGAATYTVTNTSASGPGSFTQALADANASGTASTIAFNVAGGGAHTVPGGGAATVPLTIDGTTQPGYAGTPLITMTASLTFNEPNSILRGIRFAGISSLGVVQFVTADGSIIEDNAGENLGVWIRFEGTSQSRIENNRCRNCTSLARLDANSDDNTLLSNESTEYGGIADIAFLIEGDRNTLRDNLAYGYSNQGTFVGIIITGNNNVIDRNTIRRNSLGLGLGGSGNTATGNIIEGLGETGVSISGSNTVFGGSSAAARNYVTGNTHFLSSAGVVVSGSASGVQILGNWIGVNASGAVAPNTAGILVRAGSGQGLEIRNNVISGNGFVPRPDDDEGSGIHLMRSAVVQGNRIGVLANGTTPAGNANMGILVTGSGGGLIGGTGPGDANIIAHNHAGIVSTATGSVALTISRNSIHSNTGPGLTISSAQGQRYPTLTSATNAAGTTVLNGTVSGPANSTLTIELFDNTACDSSGRGEGRSHTTTFNTTTNASGTSSFSVSVSGFSGGDVITATSTDSSGNTSEFSNCVVVASTPAPAIASVLPAEGPVEGGTNVAIRGTNFVSGATVTFGGVSATSVQFVSSELLNVVTPPNAAGAVDVVVRNPDTQSATSRDAFTYTACAKPQIATENVDVMRGSRATLRATATGDRPLSFQWYVESNGAWSRIDGATSSELEITPMDSALYQVRATNACGTDAATIRVTVCGAAIATAETMLLQAGEAAVLTVIADAPAIIAVQWYEATADGLTIIEGANRASFTTAPLHRTTTFVALVTTACGVVESNPVVVAVGSGKRRAVRH